MRYIHRDLTPKEREKFIQLYELNKNNQIYPRTCVYLLPLIYSYLIYRSLEANLLQIILGFVLGLFGIQIHFILTHMWNHGLMLEYDVWTVETRWMHWIPSVVFYAFYHHHHTRSDDWAPALSYYKTGANNIVRSHWESFSIFCLSPFSAILALFGIYYYPQFAPYVLGFEIGMILLPLAHDWVHLRKSRAYGLNYLFHPLEMMGIFATREDHSAHHNHNHPTVYQGFSSSGIYARHIDRIFNWMWDFAFYNFEHPHYCLFGYVVVIIPIVITGSLLFIDKL
jgi:hypothetical protein